MTEVERKYPLDMKLAALHNHTSGLPGAKADGLLSPHEIVAQANKLRLNAIAITDHDMVASAKAAKEYAKTRDLDLEVVIGSEISAQKSGSFPGQLLATHIIGLFLKEDIPSGKPVPWTIEAIMEQGGLVIIPHALDGKPISLGEDGIWSVLKNPNLIIHGIETNNCWAGNRANLAATDLYLTHLRKLGIAATAGSDEHFRTLGRRGLTGYYGDLREALETAQTTVLDIEDTLIIPPSDYLRVLWRGLVDVPARRFRCYVKRSFPLHSPQ